MSRSNSIQDQLLQDQVTSLQGQLTALINSISNKTRSYYSIYFDNNVASTALTQNVWTRFADITSAWNIVVNSNSDFTQTGTELKITYTGTDTKLFKLDAVVNIYKDGGGGATRTLELQWYLNGVGVGVTRQAQSNNEANIYTGMGNLPLSTGDILEAYVRNIENGNDCVLDNASFIIEEVNLTDVVYAP